jgi:hypothetical protein
LDTKSSEPYGDAPSAVGDTRYTFRILLHGCEHQPLFTICPPNDGEEIWCVACRRYRTVRGRETRFWAVKCKTCTFRRTTAQRKNEALYRAKSHATKRNHIVELWSPDLRLHATFHAQGEQLTIDLELPDGVTET